MTQPTKTKKPKLPPVELKKIFKNETSNTLINNDIETTQLTTDKKNHTKQPDDDRKSQPSTNDFVS